MDRKIQADYAFLKWCEKTSKNVVHTADVWYAAVEWADKHPTKEVKRLKRMFESDPDAYEQGRKDAIDNPTGGELLHVLEKGRKIGYKDAIDKACEWLKDNFATANEPLICYIGNSDMDVMVKHFKQYMEEQQ